MGELFALFSAASFSASNVMVRQGMRASLDNGAIVITSINMVFFWLLLLMLHLARLLPPLTWTGLLLFCLAGLLSTFGGRMFNFMAIRRLGPSRASSLRSSAPLFTLVQAYFFLAERLTPRQSLGIAGVLVGIWLLSRESRRRTDLAVKEVEKVEGEGWVEGKEAANAAGRAMPLASAVWGVLFGVASAASFGTGYIFRKMALLAVPSPFWGVAIGSSVAVLAMVAQAALQGQARQTLRANFNPRLVPRSFLAAGLFTTFGQLFSYLSIYLTKVSLATVLSSSEPLATLAFSRLLLKGEEPLNAVVLAGAALVCAGVVLIMV